MPSIRDSSERHHSSKKKHKREHYDRDDDRDYRNNDRKKRRSSRDKYRRDRSSSRDYKYDQSGSGAFPQLVEYKGQTNDQQVNAFLNSLASSVMKMPGTAPDKKEKKPRKSRWENEKANVSVPTVLPSNLTPDLEKAFLLQLQVEEIGKKLISGDFSADLKDDKRSPSPEPIYNNLGVRVNTREFRLRKKLEEQRYAMIAEIIKLNPDYRPPLDYRPLQAKYIDKVWIPQDSFPSVNFVGLIIGPRGNTLKQLEKETGAKIIIRGRGSMKDGKAGRPDGMPLPGADEPLHAYITATTEDCLKKAMDLVTRIVKEAIEVPETQNELRKNQLKQLALINGTLRDGSVLSMTGNSSASIMAMISGAGALRCGNCGSEAHKTWQCPEAPNMTSQIICPICGGAGHVAMDCKSGAAPTGNTTLDAEYQSLMAELGQNSGVLGMQQMPAYNGPPLPKLESIAPLVKKVMEKGPGGLRSDGTSMGTCDPYYGAGPYGGGMPGFPFPYVGPVPLMAGAYPGMPGMDPNNPMMQPWMMGSDPNNFNGAINTGAGLGAPPPPPSSSAFTDGENAGGGVGAGPTVPPPPPPSLAGFSLNPMPPAPPPTTDD